VLSDFDPDVPGLHALKTLVIDLTCICDIRSNQDEPDLPYLKLNPEKVMDWLKRKVEYLSTAIPKMHMFSDYHFGSQSMSP
jgi:alpha-L-fucosidase